jgi:subtilase family serine protease
MNRFSRLLRQLFAETNHQLVRERNMLKKNVFLRLLIVFLVMPVAANAQQMNQPMTNSMTFKPLPPNAKVLDPAPSDALIHLDFFVKIRNSQMLTERTLRGEYITSEDMLANFSASQDDYDYLQQWLEQRGFTTIQTDPNRMLIEVYGTVAMTEIALNTKFSVVNIDNTEYTAATTAPSLPQEVFTLVTGIVGLQPHEKRIEVKQMIVNEPQQ